MRTTSFCLDRITLKTQPQAGVTFEQVYNFLDENDAMFIGGSAQTIGASGGWMMVGSGFLFQTESHRFNRAEATVFRRQRSASEWTV
jgi:hypothetical protein